MFKIGQKVVCINNLPNKGNKYSTGRCSIKVGKIYTVLDIRTCVCGVGVIKISSEVKTICSGCGNIQNGNWKRAERFRPLNEDKGNLFIEDFLDITNYKILTLGEK